MNQALYAHMNNKRKMKKKKKRQKEGHLLKPTGNKCSHRGKKANKCGYRF
jgi:hypothetical protein